MLGRSPQTYATQLSHSVRPGCARLEPWCAGSRFLRMVTVDTRLSRAAGETAPILFTAVAFFAPVANSPLDETMAFPYHLYIMATQAVKQSPMMVWGTAFVLVAGVSLINVAAAAWRSGRRRKITW